MKENKRDFSILKQRFLEYLDAKGISKYECYKNTSITNGVLSQANGLSEDNLLKIVSFYRDLSPVWLLTGEGDMLIDQQISSHIEKTLIKNEDVSIPLVDISVAAGCSGYNNPNYLDVVDYINMPPSMLKKQAQYYCIKVRGESMSPTILDSSYVIVRVLERYEWEDMPDRHIYIISDREGKAYIKRIKNRLREHGFIVCMSDNVDKANYPNFNLQEDELNSILYVEWYISAKMPNINENYYKKVNDLEDKYEDMNKKINFLINAIKK